MRYERFNEKSYVHVVQLGTAIVAVHATPEGAQTSSDKTKVSIPVSKWNQVSIIKLMVQA